MSTAHERMLAEFANKPVIEPPPTFFDTILLPFLYIIGYIIALCFSLTIIACCCYLSVSIFDSMFNNQNSESGFFSKLYTKLNLIIICLLLFACIVLTFPFKTFDFTFNSFFVGYLFNAFYLLDTIYILGIIIAFVCGLIELIKFIIFKILNLLNYDTDCINITTLTNIIKLIICIIVILSYYKDKLTMPY